MCPRCKGPLVSSESRHSCVACARDYPIVCGIPDFRLEPDPYIGIEEDRNKGERLFAESHGRSFEKLLRFYYAETPDDPEDLAARWIAHALAEVAIARGLLQGEPSIVGTSADTALLDVGCSTGALLIAAGDMFHTLVGVDVAFRWLVVGRLRLKEAGVSATLVCANAEHLPFRDGTFQIITCTDTLEHVSDVRATCREATRVAAEAALLLFTANNRLAPLDRKSTRLNSSHIQKSRMPSSA